MTHLGSRVGTAEVTTPLSTPETVHLISYHGVELISGLFHFSLQLRCEDKALDFDEIVGKHITVKLDLAGGGQRYIDGIVGRFVQSGHDDDHATYFAELYPWLWLLTHGADCKIFQEKSVPDIIQEVFNDLGQTDFRNSLTGSYDPRVYCVQYNETHFDFVSRLMEEEGIFYYFEHAAGKHTMVLADDSTTAAACPGAEEIRCIPQTEIEIENTMVTCSIEDNVVSGVYAHDDFNFETPSTDLLVESSGQYGDYPTRRRVYEYPGGFGKNAAGTSLSDKRMAELEVPQRILRGESLAPALMAGGAFALENHYREDLNTDYLVTRVTHSATEDAYSNNFEAILKTVPLRPRRSTRKPRISGTQTAIVVGKAGEEIWTDKYGRIKVQFHWDQVGANDEKSSCWVRVARGWAGKSWGQIFIPRIGQEVVVSFEEGDPDRPLVTGSVYNAEQTVPYALPGEQTKSTIKSRSTKAGAADNFNELRFEDKKDSEEVYFQAEKDFNRVVKNNDTLTVGLETKDAGDQTIEIHNHRTVTLNEGNDKLQIKKGDRETLIDEGNDKLQIKKGDRETLIDEGDYKLQIQKGDRTILVDTGKETITIKDNHALTVSSGDHSVAVDAGKSSTEAMTSIEFKVGSNSIKIDQQGIVIKGMKVTVEGDTKAEVKATLVEVNGSATLTLKGGTVKLN